MLRLKALFRARGIKTPGRGVYDAQRRNEWLQQLPEAGARFRAQTLYTELAVLQQEELADHRDSGIRGAVE